MAAHPGGLERQGRDALVAANPKGLDRLLRQVEALPDLQVRAAAGSLQQNAEEMAAAIRRIAPKDTGEMAAGIKAMPVTTDAEGNAHVKGGLGLAWKIVAPQPARWVEHGTKSTPGGTYKNARGKTRATKRPHHATKAEPFFWVIVRAFRKRARARLGRNSRKAAKQAAQVS